MSDVFHTTIVVNIFCVLHFALALFWPVGTDYILHSTIGCPYIGPEDTSCYYKFFHNITFPASGSCDVRNCKKVMGYHHHHHLT